MCAIGRDLDTSIGAKSPATTMLGGAAIGASSSLRRPMLGGTLLAGTTGTGSGGSAVATAPRTAVGGGSSGMNKPQIQR